MIARLGDVCAISASAKENPDEYVWLLNLDMVEQQTGRILQYVYVPKEQAVGSIIRFDTDNVLYSKLRPNLNKVVLPTKDGFATSELLPLRPDTTVLCKEYLAAYLRSGIFVTWAVSKATGAKMPRLASKELLNKTIPLPSLAEQKRIASVIGTIDYLIALHKQQLAKLDELVKARFTEMFGDVQRTQFEVSTIGDECRLKSGTTFPSNKELPIGDYPYIKVSDMNLPKNEVYIKTSYAYVSAETAGVTFMEKGSVIFPKRGGAIGTNKKRILCKDTCADLNIMGVIPGQRVKTEYLYVYFQRLDLNSICNGSTVPQINNKDVAPLQLIVPPLELQERFAAFVRQTEKLRLTIRQGLDKLETLKRALMQTYFG